MKTVASTSLLPQSILLGLSSGVGYAIAQRLIKGKRNNNHNMASHGSHTTNEPLVTSPSKSPTLEFKDKIMSILSKLKQHSHKIDWSTVLILYILAQLRAKQASIAMPFLYLMLKDNEDNHLDKHNSGDNSDRGDDPTNDENDESDGGRERRSLNLPLGHLVKEEDKSVNNVDAESRNILFHDASTITGNGIGMGVDVGVGVGVVTSTTDSGTNPLPLQLPPSMSRQTEPRQHERERRNRSDSNLTQNSEVSISSLSNQRYVEMLVHNVSHTDLVLSLGIPDIDSRSNVNVDADTNTNYAKRCTGFSAKSEEGRALCRPRFSSFDMICRRILAVMDSCLDGFKAETTENHQQQAKLHQLYACIMSFPRYERSESTPRFQLVTPKKHVMLPVGFNLSQLVDDNKNRNHNEREVNKPALDLTMEDLNSLRVRSKDVSKIESFIHPYLSPSSTSTPTHKNSKRDGSGNNLEEIDSDFANKSREDTKQLHLDAIFFPLLSSLLRQWHAQIADKFGTVGKINVKKVLILVSGVGTPRNWTHSMDGNSTEALSELMEFFIKILYPDVVVVRLHSKREIFRYDENITFANKELLPCIDAYRDAHARGGRYPDEVTDNDCGTSNSTNSFDPDWKQSFSVTVSFADGAAARTHAIQSSLRLYRPTYFHFWQLKTFWHENKICDDDIEVHSFESMETVPATEVEKTSSDVQMIVEGMKRYRQDFMNNLKKNNDLKDFWLRKTGKPVLAVLLVNHPNKGLTMYRGINMEVSMPTGSLCAERNVMGSVLASDSSLRRQDLVMVAVLSVQLPNENSAASPPLMPSPPPGIDKNMCTTIEPRDQAQTRVSTEFFSEVEEKLSHFQRPENIRRSMSIGSFASIIEGNGSHETDDSSWEKMPSIENVQESTTMGNSLSDPFPEVIAQMASNTSNPSSGISTPIRKIKLYSGGDTGNERQNKQQSNIFRRKQKRTVIVHSPTDMNPLKPCGACNEWLKKVTESNPYFRVITFTDAKCSGVYVSPCQE